jgi:hypothetical protein
LIAEFRREGRDFGLKLWLLELIGEARHPGAFDLLVEQFASGDERIRDWAIRGLRSLDTPESRKVLYEAGVPRTDREQPAPRRSVPTLTRPVR